jgi:hypothetical protein
VVDKEAVSSLLNTYGISSPEGGINWANIIGGLIFGSIGMVAFMYGKKEKNGKPLCIGIALMAYPYFVPNTLLVYIIGIGLTALLYFWKD